MSWLEALVLGIVQGLTEFLPISSSAHQSIIGQFFGGQDPGSAFTAITQLGTETAVIIYFRHDIAKIIRHWSLSLVGKMDRNDPDARMGWLVIIGSVPIVLLGLAFQDAIDSALRNLWITAAMLGGFGLVIGVARGTSAATESTTSTSIAFDRTSVSTISSACSPVSGCETISSSMLTPSFLA